jgi:uncharacterized protein (DUF58 family)
MSSDEHGLRAALRRRVEARWERWLDRRCPPAREVRLQQRNVYIMPSAQGYVFLALLLALLIAGINYENNLVFALAFLLGGLFVVAVLHTYANLAGLAVSGLSPAPVFAGEPASFGLLFRDVARRPHDAVEACWRNADPVEARVPPDGEDSVVLHLPALRRGWFRPGRIRLRSHYPLGLLRAWSWVDVDLACLVYPRPASHGLPPAAAGAGADGAPVADPGAEDFSGFRRYVAGDPLRHVAWRTLAKGQPLQTREYLAFADRSVWLSWEQTADAGGVEERLSLLCRWVLELHRLQAPFGLVLPGARIEPGQGDAHREQSLAALALFGTPA